MEDTFIAFQKTPDLEMVNYYPLKYRNEIRRKPQGNFTQWKSERTSSRAIILSCKQIIPNSVPGDHRLAL